MTQGALDDSPYLLPNTPKAVGTLHFIGIGGVGMSALALALQQNGYKVQGSDLSHSPTIETLKRAGIPVFHKHAARNVGGAQTIIVSSAIKARNVELTFAKQQNRTILKRGQLLGLMTQNKPTIAITGSHGKTTTTSLTGKLLIAANADPLILTGGLMQDYQSNVYLGKGKFLVAEMDESDGSHRNAHPFIGVVTNIDQEHMAFYKTKKELLRSFEVFFDNLTKDGTGIACLDNPLVQELMPHLHTPLLTYGTSPKAQVRLTNIKPQPEGFAFDAFMPDGSCLKDLLLSLHGHHNVLNAGAALTIAFQLGLNEETIRYAFQDFRGVKRRFQTTGTLNSVRIIDDYAHHPTEIKATLETAKQLCRGRLFAVCEPHRYTRLQDLFEDFADALKVADCVITVPVYSAGESPIQGVSSPLLTEEITNKGTKSLSVNTFDDVADYLHKHLRKDDLVICMGAGKITQLAHMLPTSAQQAKTAGNLAHAPKH